MGLLSDDSSLFNSPNLQSRLRWNFLRIFLNGEFYRPNTSYQVSSNKRRITLPFMRLFFVHKLLAGGWAILHLVAMNKFLQINNMWPDTWLLSVFSISSRLWRHQWRRWRGWKSWSGRWSGQWRRTDDQRKAPFVFRGYGSSKGSKWTGMRQRGKTLTVTPQLRKLNYLTVCNRVRQTTIRLDSLRNKVT